MRRQTRILLLSAVAAAALISPVGALAQERLIATVGTNDAHVITLTHANGAPVRDIPAGTYTIEVRDRSRLHNFRLTGPGVERRTDIADTGTVTWTVTFRDQSIYEYLCESHPSDMYNSFTTGGGPPEPPPAPPPPVGSTLYATVGPGHRISFHTRRGARIRRVRPGRYRIVVRDRSRSHSFQLRGSGVNKRTRIAFAGTQIWQVTFRRGALYRYWCNSHPRRMRGSFRA
jgi:plastocyanin